MENKWYQPQEFAHLVGMTKRALRYYKEKQILMPAYVDEEGYGYYSEQNLYEAQQILALRFLEMSVEDIRQIQESKMDIGTSLDMQKRLLKDKVIQIQYLIAAIDEMQEAIGENKEVPWESLFEAVRFTKHEMVAESMMQYYDERAYEYEEIYKGGGPATYKPEIYKKDVNEIIKLLKGFKGEKVIDIGCGTGYWLKGYHSNFKTFTFLDQSSKMLEACKKSIQTYQIQDQSELIEADFLQWIPNKETYFDSAVVGFVIGHFMTIQENQFFDKLSRIIKPRGRILMIDNTWTAKRAMTESKENISNRTLKNGKAFAIYKKYFEKEDVIQLFEKHHIAVKEIYWGTTFFAAVGEWI